MRKGLKSWKDIIKMVVAALIHSFLIYIFGIFF